MPENIDIKFLNNYISNIVKKNLNNKINIKGFVDKLSEKNNNFFFSIKSENEYQINCIFWKNNNTKDLILKNNITIEGVGNLDFNLKFGSYFINFLEITILEDNSSHLEDLVSYYKKLGLFNKDRKWINYCSNIAIITSLNGIVVHDIISVAKKKNNYCKLFVLNSSIQGKNSVNDIIKNIKFININLKFIDIIIIARGGGNINDLNTFNNKLLLQSVYDSRIPIISAIGHKKDITLIDYVADKSAITPSVAADVTIFNQQEISEKLKNFKIIIETKFNKLLLEIERRIKNYYIKIKEISPIIYLNNYKNKLNKFENLFNENFNKYKKYIDCKVNSYENLLEKKNPYKILENGYTIIYDKDGNVIDDMFLFSSLSKLNMKIQFKNGFKYFLIDKIY